MTLEHTPGPWTADSAGLVTAGPRRLHIAQTATTGMGHAAEANAQLLAAAPDLLTVLRELVEEADATGGNQRTVTRYTIDKARAILNKTTGA